ncbi:MAG: hypothetical protein ACXW1W_17285 [Methylococcaceae bacterium]
MIAIKRPVATGSKWPIADIDTHPLPNPNDYNTFGKTYQAAK